MGLLSAALLTSSDRHDLIKPSHEMVSSLPKKATNPGSDLSVKYGGLLHALHFPPPENNRKTQCGLPGH